MKEKLKLAGKKELLIKSGARLYSLGLDLEAAREKVRRLAAQGKAYDSFEMIQAVNDYTELKRLWDDLEREHLVLRQEIQKSHN